jgi:uncharacterized SAM-binding protein YcdF (DUF218 family)
MEQQWTQSVILRIKKVIARLVFASGLFFLLLLLFSFTRLPFDIQRWLGSSNSAFSFTPASIIMLGGSGMPSESNLMRLYYTAALAEKYPDAVVYIAHPHDTSVTASMRNFLVRNSVRFERIKLMHNGTNTREQALELLKFQPALKTQNVVIVTSPENMFRSVAAFRKSGFRHTGGVPSYENAMFTDLSYDYRKAGGKAYVPDVSSNLSLRYNFWNYLKLEIICIREFLAIFYYWLNDWI